MVYMFYGFTDAGPGKVREVVQGMVLEAKAKSVESE
jgi:hypothetical protein